MNDYISMIVPMMDDCFVVWIDGQATICCWVDTILWCGN